MFTAIIPLRAGSKRIPGKNTVIFNNKPLFCHSVDEALLSKKIHKIIISTNDENVVNITNDVYKKEVESGRIKIFDRDPEYAGDLATTHDLVIEDIFKKDRDIDKLLILQATSPLRKHKHIDDAIDIFLGRKDIDSLVSITTVDENPYWQFVLENDKMVPLISEKYIGKRSQDLPTSYVLNGAIYIIDMQTLINHRSFITKNTYGFLMDKYHSVDIDTQDDLLFAKFLVDNKLV